MRKIFYNNVGYENQIFCGCQSAFYFYTTSVVYFRRENSSPRIYSGVSPASQCGINSANGGDEQMALSFTEKLGFLREVTEFMEKNSDILKKAGFDAVAGGKEQKAKNDTVASANEKQESLKAQLHEQTKLVNSAMLCCQLNCSCLIYQAFRR